MKCENEVMLPLSLTKSVDGAKSELHLVLEALTRLARQTGYSFSELTAKARRSDGGDLEVLNREANILFEEKRNLESLLTKVEKIIRDQQ